MLFFFFTHSLSWWGHAHMLIGRIAEMQMTSKQKKKIETILSYNQMPIQDITRSSTWHDDLKDTYKLYLMGNWHFSDKVLIFEESPDIQIAEPTYNITSYLKSAWKSLQDPTTTSLWAWNFHLRGLTHFIGDVHTPHHNCALYSKEFPTGDAGGNGYKLNCPYGSACMNIHFLWDSVALYAGILNPLIPLYKEEFQKNVSLLLDEIPKSSLTNDLEAYDPLEWNDESFQDAKDYGYNTPQNQWPNETFFETVRTVGKKRIALAGYRLGHILAELADKAPISTTTYPSEIASWVINAVLLILIIVFSILNFRKPTKYSQLVL